MNNLFGKGNFFLELQPSKQEEQILVNKKLIELSQATNTPYIFTTDTHYLKKEDRKIHEAFLKSQDGDREVADFYGTTYLMNTEELENYCPYFDKSIMDIAYQNIQKIMDSCENYSLLKPLKIPSLAWKYPLKIYDVPSWYDKIPYLKNFYESDFDGDNLLALKVIEKINSDITLQTEEAYAELNSNLETTWVSSEVNKAHWSAYFLNLEKILDVCWDAGTLVGPGRGSGVGFLLLYVLGITQINPLRETTRTFWWRFLNPDRVSVLDIDTDIEGGRRATVLKALRQAYGEDRVANVATFGTEKSKQAIQTAARGLEIDNDVALYLSSLVPADRGQTRTLKQCFYGDEENDFKPIPQFVYEMTENYPDLWEVAQKIEGLICRIGEHAGGVVFVDEPFTNSTALMRTPSGDIITQFDLHDDEKVSLIKIDLLSVEGLDKIHNCIDLLIEHGYVTPKATLRETYEDLIGIYNLERDSIDMWKMVWNHEIQSLFQMEQQSGIQGIALTHPESVDDLAVLNSVIRLMAQEKGQEQPLNKFARFKNDISLWYDEMNKYGLTEEEQKILEPILKTSYGICESQEKFMQLVQLPECGGYPLAWADSLRKAIAKKNPAGFNKLEKEFYENIKEKNLSYKFCHYVWNVLVSTSKGYGFNASHTLAYSLVALQEMNLCYKFPVIFWNCACLITDAGGVADNKEEDFDEDEIKKTSSDYNKIAQAISKMKTSGINIVPPDINHSNYTFTPDVENNQILFGMKGMLNVGEEIIESVIKNRPYTSLMDFYDRVHPKKNAMVSLIKGGCFDNLEERKMAMAWYLYQESDMKKKITLQNMRTLIKYGIIPKTEQGQMAVRVFEFNRYLKATCAYDNKDIYILNERAINFMTNNTIGDNLITQFQSEYYINVKSWEKIYDNYMNILRTWMKENQEKILQDLNTIIFKEEWDKYAKGSFSHWEMEVLCFYHHPHELINVNTEKYGIADFLSLPEEPVVSNTFVRSGKTVQMFELNRICGTCVAKNKNKSTVTLLTTSGVVTVKFPKDYFSIFDKQISEKDEEGKKHVVEKSWFNRGSMIVVMGIRRGDTFIPKKYASTPGHQLYKITEVLDNGEIALQIQRKQGSIEEESE